MKLQCAGVGYGFDGGVSWLLPVLGSDSGSGETAVVVVAMAVGIHGRVGGKSLLGYRSLGKSIN